MFALVEGSQHLSPIIVRVGKFGGRNVRFLVDVFGVTQRGTIDFAAAINFFDFAQAKNRTCHAVHYRMIKVGVKISRGRRLDNVYAPQRLVDNPVRLAQFFHVRIKSLVVHADNFDRLNFTVENLTQVACFGVKDESATEDVMRVEHFVDRVDETLKVNLRRQFEQAADIHHGGLCFVKMRVDQPTLNRAQRVKFFRGETVHIKIPPQTTTINLFSSPSIIYFFSRTLPKICRKFGLKFCSKGFFAEPLSRKIIVMEFSAGIIEISS